MMKKMVAIAAAMLVSAAAQAAPVKYNFNWTGSSGYSMNGNFTFDSASAVDGAIRDNEVTSLFFEGFLNGTSIGSTSNANTLTGFNFNFNTVSGQFFLNGNSFDNTGQRWNLVGNGLGFAAGSASSLLFLGSSGISGSNVPNPSPLTATLVSTNAVPEPASLALVGLGLVGVAATRRKARK